uniref:hypothetical protein n=1 Tax=uncultured Pseudomonas sp. TaxID=114707 RepID=UPI0025CD5855
MNSSASPLPSFGCRRQTLAVYDPSVQRLPDYINYLIAMLFGLAGALVAPSAHAGTIEGINH